jgi:alpha-galactosidase
MGRTTHSATEKTPKYDCGVRYGLLTLLKRDGRAALCVRSCFWADATKDATLKEACAAAGGVFVDISALAKDERNYARSERKIAHEGVARHPGDQGMRAIADAITAALAQPAK